MNKTLLCALLVFALVGLPLDLSARDLPLVAGTLFTCTLNEPDFSSRTALVGDPLVCYARPIHEFDCEVFPRGTQLAGRFAEYRSPGRLVGKGWIKLEFDRVILPQGQAPIAARVISVQGFKVNADGRIEGRGHARRDAVGWAIPLLWPVKAATLLERGPVPALRGERVVTLRLLDDVLVPCSNWHRFGSAESSLLFGHSSSDGLRSEGSSSTANGAEGAVSSRRKEETGAGDDLVVDLGKHSLRVTTSRPRAVSRSESGLYPPQ